MDLDRNRQVLLERFDHLAQGRIRTVVFAQPGPRPPEPHQYRSMPRVSFVLAGRKHIGMSDGQERVDARLDAGTALFMPPFAWTQPHADSAREILGVVFMREFTRFIWSRHRGDDAPIVADAWYHAAMPMRGAGAHLLNALCARARETRSGGPQPHDALLLQALGRIAHDHLEAHPLAPGGRALATWEAVRQFLGEHFHRDLSRAAVARAFRLHPNYLSSLFLAHGQESFRACLLRMRMERAAELLAAGMPGVQQVGAACGYPRAASFIAAFRRFHGATPGTFARPR